MVKILPVDVARVPEVIMGAIVLFNIFHFLNFVDLEDLFSGLAEDSDENEGDQVG